ncbi:MAG: ferric reductase-like transmembrane domain-containing protein [Devosia sp.]
MLKTLIDSRPLLWLVLAIPGLAVLGLWAAGVYTYGAAVSESGEWAARLLILTLAVTPLRLIFRRGPWLIWLVRRRRDLGVATFCYAAGHTVAYLIRKADFGLIIEEGLDLWLLAGWIAFAVLIALALTSTDQAVRAMRRWWKRLHRLVYIAAALVFVHWVLSAFDPTSAYVHLGIIAALEAIRVVLEARQRVT